MGWAEIMGEGAHEEGGAGLAWGCVLQSRAEQCSRHGWMGVAAGERRSRRHHRAGEGRVSGKSGGGGKAGAGNGREGWRGTGSG